MQPGTIVLDTNWASALPCRHEFKTAYIDSFESRRFQFLAFSCCKTQQFSPVWYQFKISELTAIRVSAGVIFDQTLYIYLVISQDFGQKQAMPKHLINEICIKDCKIWRYQGTTLTLGTLGITVEHILYDIVHPKRAFVGQKSKPRKAYVVIFMLCIFPNLLQTWLGYQLMGIWRSPHCLSLLIWVNLYELYVYNWNS